MNFTEFLTTGNLVPLILKPALIVLGFIYLIYAIAIFRQTQVMAKTLIVSNDWIIVFISFIQLVVAIILVAVPFVIL
ncbi:hypothetical protein HYT33_03115 [Candidatus Roizmanbacteria bacterium]|nr:hypothetical protein [Candidatus Roizmanbacteria bacterium]